MLRQELVPVKSCLSIGPTQLPIYNLETGEVHPASLVIAVLGASNYTYAEAIIVGIIIIAIKQKKTDAE